MFGFNSATQHGLSRALIGLKLGLSRALIGLKLGL